MFVSILVCEEHAYSGTYFVQVPRHLGTTYLPRYLGRHGEVQRRLHRQRPCCRSGEVARHT